jgi:hypothetical protein
MDVQAKATQSCFHTHRILVAEFGNPISAAEQEMKQRRTSYMLATDQRRNPREEYFASRQAPDQQKAEPYSYDPSAKSRCVDVTERVLF